AQLRLQLADQLLGDRQRGVELLPRPAVAARDAGIGVLQRGRDEFVLVPEEPVDRAGGALGGLGDARDGRVVVPVSADQLHGGVEYPLEAGFAAGVTSSGVHPCSLFGRAAERKVPESAITIG